MTETSEPIGLEPGAPAEDGAVLDQGWRQRLEAHARGHDFAPLASRFYFLRHGQTEHNRRWICQGQRDVPLNAAGRAQALAAADLLAPVGLRAISASDLSRVTATAAPLAARLGLVASLDPRLRERGFGRFEGQPIQGPLWAQADASVEPIEAFVDRCLAGLAAALVADDVLVVSHGGVRRVLFAALGLTVAEWTSHNALPVRCTKGTGGWAADILTARGAWPVAGPPPPDLAR